MVGQQVPDIVVSRLARDKLPDEGNDNVSEGAQGELTVHVLPSDLLEEIRELGRGDPTTTLDPEVLPVQPVAFGSLQEVGDDGLHRSDEEDVAVQEISQLPGTEDRDPGETSKEGGRLDYLVDEPGPKVLEHIAGNLAVANPGVHELGAAGGGSRNDEAENRQEGIQFIEDVLEVDQVADVPLQGAERIHTADRVGGVLQESLEQRQPDTLRELGRVHPGSSHPFVSEVLGEILGDVGRDASAEVLHELLNLQPDLIDAIAKPGELEGPTLTIDLGHVRRPSDARRR